MKKIIISALIIVGTLAITSWVVNSSSIVGRWKLDENAGNVAVNSVLNTKNGTLTNGAIFSKMQKGNCVYFDGVNDYITIPDADQYSFGNGGTDKPFTITVWLYNQNTSGQTCRIATKSGGGIYEWLITTRPTGTYSMFLYHSNASASIGSDAGNASSDVNLWTFLAFSYSGSKSYTGIKIYRNGVAYTSYTSSGAGVYTGMSNTTASILIGNYTTTYAKGYIKDLQIHNRELSATEINNLYVESYQNVR